LGFGDVGDVGVDHTEVSGGRAQQDPREDHDGEEGAEGVRPARDDTEEGGDEQNFAPAHLVAEAAEIGGHQKLSDAVDGEDRPDGDAAQAEALGAGLQVRDDDPEGEQVQEDGEERRGHVGQRLLHRR